MLNYSAPGKLFISGEWAILEVGNYGLVSAVNNRVHVSIKNSRDITVTAEEFKIHDAKAIYDSGKISFPSLDDKSKDTLKLLGEALSIALRFLEEHKITPKPFHMATNSKDTQFEVDGQLKKIGFGSSAAVVVAAITAVLDFHGYHASKDEIYKLSTIAHYYAQGKIGSAFDVAASTYGGLFVYSRFDPYWLTKKFEAGEKLVSIVKEKWPSLVIEEMEVPKDFHLLVGWTRDPASTSAMVKQMNEFKTRDSGEYFRMYNRIGQIAKNAIGAFKAGHYSDFFLYMIENENALSELGAVSGVNIETPELKQLSDIAIDCGASGKLSGAGGGDCGIAICFDNKVAEDVVAKWRAAGLYPLDVTIDREGVRKD